MRTTPDPYRGFRFPAEVISHAVWLYHCFSLSLREVELILAERGVVVSHESIPGLQARTAERSARCAVPVQPPIRRTDRSASPVPAKWPASLRATIAGTRSRAATRSASSGVSPASATRASRIRGGTFAATKGGCLRLAGRQGRGRTRRGAQGQGSDHRPGYRLAT